MNDHFIRDTCREIGALDWDKIADKLCRLNQRDRAGTVVPDGYARRTLNTDIPSNDPESLSSVEAAADTRAFGTLEPDEVHKATVLALSALGQIDLAVGALRDNLKRGEQVQVWEKPIGHQAPQCKSVGCDGPSVARGWCDACRKWISRNPTNDGVDPLTVPADVIQERTKRRKRDINAVEIANAWRNIA